MEPTENDNIAKNENRAVLSSYNVLYELSSAQLRCLLRHESAFFLRTVHNDEQTNEKKQLRNKLLARKCSPLHAQLNPWTKLNSQDEYLSVPCHEVVEGLG